MARGLRRFKRCLEHDSFRVRGASMVFAEDGVQVLNEFGWVHLLRRCGPAQNEGS
jgi:hypothetical protein